jgi:hypothetical protein
MDPINSEALTGLATALQSLLPPPADPALAPELDVSPTRFRTTGLNGFVGVSHDPDGEIVGRRVNATAVVGVKTKTLATLNAAVSGVTAAVVGAPRSDLRKLGILDVGVGALGPQSPPAPGPTGHARQDVTFAVSYEFLKLPAAPNGVIAEIPLDLELSREHDPSPLIATEFGPQSLELFEAVDDPAADKDGPSSWTFEAAGGRIQQSSGIWGGTTAVNASKPGTYLVLRTTPSRPAVADFILRTEVQSDSDQGIGVVFRYQDTANFYFALANKNKGYRLLGRKVGGAFQQLATPALDATKSFTVGALTRLKLVAVGPDFELFVDGQPALAGADPALAEPGRVGLMTFQNPQAFFYGLELVAI